MATWRPATPARSPSPAATRTPSCRPATPSPPPTRGRIPSRSRSRRRGRSRSPRPIRRTSSLTGTRVGHHRPGDPADHLEPSGVDRLRHAAVRPRSSTPRPTCPAPSPTRPAAGAILDAGSGQTLSVTFTPQDATDYTTAAATTTITVTKATPILDVTRCRRPLRRQPVPGLRHDRRRRRGRR